MKVKHFIQNKLYYKILCLKKENTKKERFSYKKGKKNSRISSEGQSYLYSRHTGGSDDLTDYKGLIYHFYEPRFIYFAETDDEYKYMKKTIRMKFNY